MKKLTDNEYRKLREQAIALISPMFNQAEGVDRDQAMSVLHELQTYQIELEIQNQTLKETQDALVASCDRYSNLYDFAPVSYVTLDTRGFVLEANLTTAKMLQTSRNNIVGHPLTRHIEPEDQDIFYRHVNALRSDKTQQTFELRLKRENASLLAVQMEGGVQFDELEKREEYRFVILDISKRKAAEKERDAVTLQLHHAQKSQALGTLAGGIAHEFNNVLAIIMNGTELIIQDLDEQSGKYELAKHVLTASQRAKDLIRQILVYTHRVKSTRHPLDLGAAVKDALAMTQHSLPASIEVWTDMMSNCTVLADPGEISQIVMNLCSNAVHAMNGRGSLGIALNRIQLIEPETKTCGTTLPPGAYSVLSVSDDGCGMTPSLINRMFDPFYTTKEPGSGTGMGLPLVYGLIQRYGGAIDVESSPGKGSTFHLFFPQAVSVEPESEKREHALSPLAETDAHILLVDDDRLLVAMLKELLETLGYSVTMESDSIRARDRFSTDPDRFDLVVTDQVMPGMCGDELAISMLQIRPDIPIIALTGHSDHLTPERADTLGIKRLLYKPISKRELGACIKDVLNQASQPKK